jgi:aminoglycoside/choline kinase family phosphotransferase
MGDPEQILRQLFEQHFDNSPQSVVALPASGSDRKYYRLKSQNNSAIGVINDSIKENRAFISFSNHFKTKSLPVPEVFISNDEQSAYLQSDLGDDTLFSILSTHGLSDEVRDYYVNVVKWLPSFQCNGINGLNLEYCWPRRKFDQQSMMWDLNYFKYYYAKLTSISFDEQALEDDFKKLVDFLTEAPSVYFMYRDFQSRNIMVKDGQLFFIDYQGGRLGPLQYDLASLLYDAKANLPQPFRNELLDIYLNAIKSYLPDFNKEEFLRYYPAFILMRILQALGAYGFRGYYQKKAHFLQSVPYALANLKTLFNENDSLPNLKELKKLLLQKPAGVIVPIQPPAGLNVRVVSFSYKQGIPVDHSGNGGGFVFDCRALPNPGRLEQYKLQSGLDHPVIEYLKSYPETEAFMKSVTSLVDAAVENYLQRGFQNLMVSFGCTGGRHRSVYFAEKLATHLKQKFNLDIIPEHSEKANW